MRIFLCLFTGCLLTACGSTFIDYDYDKNVDFTTYKTYAYDYERIVGFSEFDEKRFTKSVDSILESRGFRFSETPDILVGANSSEVETQSRNTLGIGIGSGGGNLGIGVSGGIPLGGREMHRELTITIYDEDKNTTVWEAISESDLKIKASANQKDVYFDKLIAKIFKKFPNTDQ